MPLLPMAGAAGTLPATAGQQGVPGRGIPGLFAKFALQKCLSPTLEAVARV